MADESVDTTTVADEQNSTDSVDAEAAEQRETYIDELKGKVGELNSKYADLTARHDQSVAEMSELKGRLDEQSRHISPEEGSEDEAKDPWEYSEEQLDEFNEEPSKFIALLRQEREARVLDAKNLQVNIGRYLDANNDALEERFGSLDKKFEATSPEMLPWRTAIDELKQNEKFSKLDDDTLKAIAEEKGMSPDYTYQGSPGGQRPRGLEQKARTFSSDDKSTMMAQFLNMTGNDTEKAKKMVDRYVERHGAAQ